MKKVTVLSVLTGALLLLNSCQKFDFWNIHHGGSDENTTSGQVAIDWYKLQLRILLERNSSLNGAYFAYMGIGLYESVQPGIKNASSFSNKLYQMPVMPAKENNKEYNWEASANATMASLVKAYYSGLTTSNLASIDSLENAWNEKLKKQTSNITFIRSQSFGKNIATSVYNWSVTDNYNTSNAGYIPPVFVGAWVPTPPAFANGVLPYVGLARPLLAADANRVAPPFPAAYNEKTGSDFYNIEKTVYNVSQTLTTEQKNIALFWVDQGNGTGYTPDGHNISLATQALMQRNASLGIAAEVYAKAGIAERESIIICFRSKYAYNVVRPVTYINRVINPDWLPFITTPPHPEYPAAHAFVTGTVMEAVTKVLGSYVNLTDHTYDFRGWTPRTYSTLFAAAEEAGMSRLYGGIHTMPSIKTGLDLGKDLGDKIGSIKLHD